LLKKKKRKNRLFSGNDQTTKILLCVPGLRLPDPEMDGEVP
jgi:hypothetical protein